LQKIPVRFWQICVSISLGLKVRRYVSKRKIVVVLFYCKNNSFSEVGSTRYSNFCCYPLHFSSARTSKTSEVD